ncbi:hypothetical protein SprV_0200811800 [Sparganum proliferum]
MDQLARWQELLQDFDFECQFRAGHKNGNADAPSRLPFTIGLEDKSHNTDVNAIIISEPTRYAWSSIQSFDPDIAVIYRHLTQGWTGRDMRLLYPLSGTDTTTPHDYATRLREIIRSAHNATRTMLGRSSLHQKEQHDRHSSGATHQISDLVIYYNPSHPHRTSATFHCPCQGPIVVLGTPSPTNLLIRDAIHSNARPFAAHLDKLKPYQGRLSTCSPDSLPIHPTDHVLPVAIGVIFPSLPVDLSTEGNAPP